jgi:uncharacterized membrane-anchored protein YitT (DUF2179 family)
MRDSVHQASTSLGRLVLAVDWRAALPDYAMLTAGAALMAVNLNLFLAPANIAPGGVTGAAILINHFTGWPIGLTMLVLNVPLIILGFVYLGRFRFLTRTLYAVLVYNLGADVVAHWIPAGGITQDLLLNALFGGVVAGIGTGLVYRGGGTTAGTGTLSRVLQVRTGIPISQLYILVDGGIILLAGLVFGWDKGLYAFIALFVWGLAADYVQEGPSVVRMALIVTDRPKPVAQAILNELRLGVTGWPAQGMFTEQQHTILYCTVSRPQERLFRTIVSRADPSAFVVTGHGHQASGGMLGQLRARETRVSRPVPYLELDVRKDSPDDPHIR